MVKVRLYHKGKIFGYHNNEKIIPVVGDIIVHKDFVTDFPKADIVKIRVVERTLVYNYTKEDGNVLETIVLDVIVV